MTNALTIWTYDWVPPGPRGHVRDIRLRWACEEGGLDYDVKSVPFQNRGPDISRASLLARCLSSRMETSPCSKAAPAFCIWRERAKN